MNTNETSGNHPVGNHPVGRLLEAARQYRPFGEPDDFGFETRLRAALAEVPPTLAEYLARFSWRVSAVSLPLLVAAAVFSRGSSRSPFPRASAAW